MSRQLLPRRQVEAVPLCAGELNLCGFTDTRQALSLVVPTMAWILAGCRRIQAMAMALGVAPYFSANWPIAALSSGNFSLPRKVPWNMPYWKGDHGWMGDAAQAAVV